MMMAKKPPTAPAASFVKSISVTEDIMSRPTHTSAGMVAKLGMAKKIGENTRATMNSTPVTSAVRPVRPPAATPALLST